MSAVIDPMRSNGPLAVTIAGSAPGTKGDPGLSVSSVVVDAAGNLVFTMSDKSTIKAPLDAVVQLAAMRAATTIGSNFDDIALSVKSAAGSAQTAEQAKAGAGQSAQVAQAAVTQALPLLQSAQQALSGVSAESTAAKVLITAAQAGIAPLHERGWWDASANNPQLTSGTGTEGDVYYVSVAGNTALDGNAKWDVGDAAWFFGGQWQYYSRAVWPAIAKSITALRDITVAGIKTGGGGSQLWAVAWLNAFAEILAGIQADGSPIFPGVRARVGPHKFEPGALSGAGMILLDDLGSVLDNSSSRTWPGLDDAGPSPSPIARRLLARGPGVGDCASRGFGAGSLWLYDGALYRSLYDAQDAACWDVLTDQAAAPLAAGFGSALAAAYGLDAMVSGYTGPAIDVVTTVAAAPVTTTVAVGADGRLDQIALDTVLALADAGTSATVSRWYDQSGGGHHLTVPSGASAPRIGQAQVNGRPCISFDTTGAAVPLRLANADISFGAGTFTVCAVGRASGTNCSGDDRISAISVGSGTARIATVSGIDEDAHLGLWDGAVLQPGHLMQSSNPGVMGISAAGKDTVTVWHGSTPDPVTVTAAALAGDLTGLSIGSGDGLSYAANIQCVGLIALTSAMTQAQADLLTRRSALRYGFAPQTAYRVICIGDSRTAGFLNQDGACWPTMLPDYLDDPADIYNVAVSGSTTRDAVNYTLASIQAALSGSAVPTLCTLWLGVNDFGRIGGSDYSVHARIKTLIDGVVAAGARHVFLISEAPMENQLTWQGATASGYFGQHVTLINPFTSGRPLADHTDAVLWHADGVHPTRAGDRCLASVVADAINTYFEGLNP
ncbi:SGNH/GDSL hydrolase family protein [Acetobacter tropicalis]|uniref:Uncharacterized protein n=1 Tax=Acetobacter tropicalis TaxID=104102 RepID=A0A094ZXT1_9PROT|nr:SGNH/GDSL hydrolase family protein [Acetobacter tropicalis]KAA8383812.1 SGNH/GDSL hydrolase family protein [Acetobacter tropicalis]KAA8386283.1 SGNH/GDSL hydrolase family protein [Acetobacter tropicalis]KGB26736.1 hypothetical protein AtDm6_0002 [Acetobacter tropicalis]MDO8172390.1 SGNH/GDSL hydrolase family protein [Acetobacter tropicalis]